MKSACIRSYSGPHFSSFGLNTERFSVSLRIQSDCEKMRTRITPNTDAFYAVNLARLSWQKCILLWMSICFFETRTIFRLDGLWVTLVYHNFMIWLFHFTWANIFYYFSVGLRVNSLVTPLRFPITLWLMPLHWSWSHTFQKTIFFICFNDSPSKMMKNAFHFIWKPLFVLKIFKFFSWLFAHVERTAWLER